MFNEKDTEYMKLALELASKSIGKTSPNPMVGAVIVKNGKIIGKGYHKKAGDNHAEIEVLNSTPKEKIKDSTMYVSLEPCCHQGKTPRARLPAVRHRLHPRPCRRPLHGQ